MTCHDSPEVGNRSVRPINIGLSDAASNSPAARNLDIANLPIYTFRQNVTIGSSERFAIGLRLAGQDRTPRVALTR